VAEVLSTLRRVLPVQVACGRPACQAAVARAPFARLLRKDEVCPLCQEEEPGQDGNIQNRTYDFRGARVLVVGGDIVGSRYPEFFARHGLGVEWVSGFDGLGARRAGFGGVRLVLVILKQVSHTLLREVLAAVHQYGVQVSFCPRRGLSGVLAHLVQILKPAERAPG